MCVCVCVFVPSFVVFVCELDCIALRVYSLIGLLFVCLCVRCLVCAVARVLVGLLDCV